MRAIDYFDKGAEAFPDHTAIIDRDKRYSYREMRAYTERIARALWASGLRSEDRIAIYSGNDARVLFCMLGLLRAGAVWVPINYRNALDANVEYMNYVEVSWLFYHSSFREAATQIRERVPSLCNLICIDAPDSGNPSLEQFMQQGKEIEPFDWGDALGNADRLVGMSPLEALQVLPRAFASRVSPGARWSRWPVTTGVAKASSRCA